MRRTSFFFESLERRDLFAAFLDPATNNLVVIGTNAPETISVTTQCFAGFTPDARARKRAAHVRHEHGG